MRSVGSPSIYLTVPRETAATIATPTALDAATMDGDCVARFDGV